MGGTPLLDSAGAGGAKDGDFAAGSQPDPPGGAGASQPPSPLAPVPSEGESGMQAQPLLGDFAAATPQAALQNLNAATNIVIREVEYIQALTERISALIASNERMARIYRKNFWYMGLLATFLRGILMGFGWVIGTTIVVGVFILFLHKFDSVPVVGEFVGRIMEYLQQRR